MNYKKNTSTSKSAWDRYDYLAGLRYFVRVAWRDVPGRPVLVCAFASLEAAKFFARSYDKVYYEVGLFDSDCDMKPIDF